MFLLTRLGYNMKIYSFIKILPLIAVLVLTGCGTLYTAKRTKYTGSEFDVALSRKYVGLADRLYGSKSRHFAQKALDNASGGKAKPESITGEKSAELKKAKARLDRVLSTRNKKSFPGSTAEAQVAFDCWVAKGKAEPAKVYKGPKSGVEFVTRPTGKSGAWSLSSSASTCKDDFNTAASTVEQLSKKYGKGEFTPFVIRFAPNSAKLDGKGEAKVKDAALYVKNFGAASITVEGHADKRGDEKANLALSQNRADAVKASLAKAGVTGARITVKAQGESKASKSDAEARRVQIIVEQPGTRPFVKSDKKDSKKGKKAEVAKVESKPQGKLEAKKAPAKKIEAKVKKAVEAAKKVEKKVQPKADQ